MITLGSRINANSEFKKPRVPMLIFNKIHLKQIVKPLPEMITILSSYMSVQQDKAITSA